MTRSTRTNRLLFRLGTAILALGLVLLGLEIGLRLYGFDPIGRFAEGQDAFLRESANPDLGYELTPNAKGFAWNTHIEVNSHGYRDRDYVPEKPPGTRRIVVIGDSIVFGNGLEADQRFPERLETMLEGADPAVEVLNLGVGGYDTLNEVAFLEQVGLKFQADDVVVGFCLNDLGVISANLVVVRLLERYGRVIRSVRILQLLMVRIDRHLVNRELERLNRESVFRRRYARRIASIASDAELQGKMTQLAARLRQLRPSTAVRFLSWYTSAARVGRLRHAFERLRRLADEHGFRVVVVIVPYLREHGHPDAFHRAYDIVAHEAERVEFRVVDVYEPLKAYGFERLLLEGDPNPFHPNPAGHRIIARKLFEELGFRGARNR